MVEKNCISSKPGISYERRDYDEQGKSGHLKRSSEMTTVKSSRVAGWLLSWVIDFVL
jgi:hypothetical protein